MEGTAIVEPLGTLDDSLQVEDALVEVNKDGSTAVMVRNTGDTTCELKVGMVIGEVMRVEIVQESLTSSEGYPIGNKEKVTEEDFLNLYSVNLSSESVERTKWRQTQLMRLLEQTKAQISDEEYLPLKELLTDYHDIFSLEDNEQLQGETDICT